MRPVLAAGILGIAQLVQRGSAQATSFTCADLVGRTNLRSVSITGESGNGDGDPVSVDGLCSCICADMRERAALYSCRCCWWRMPDLRLCVLVWVRGSCTCCGETLGETAICMHPYRSYLVYCDAVPPGVGRPRTIAADLHAQYKDSYHPVHVIGLSKDGHHLGNPHTADGATPRGGLHEARAHCTQHRVAARQ